MNGPPKPTLPYGWIERISTTFPDRVYYFNTLTGASTWIVPFMHKPHPLKGRPKTPPLERDSGISSISGASLSSYSHEQGDEDGSFGPGNDLENTAEFSPHVSPKTVSNDDSANPTGNRHDNAPMWSDFMDNYIRQSEQNDKPSPCPSSDDKSQTYEKPPMHREDVTGTSKHVEGTFFSGHGYPRMEIPQRSIQQGSQVMVRGGQVIIPSPSVQSQYDRDVAVREVGREGREVGCEVGLEVGHEVGHEVADVGSGAEIKTKLPGLLRTPDKHLGKNVNVVQRRQRVTSAEKRQQNLSWSKRHWEEDETEYSGPPRVSVKDRLGWLEVKAKKKRKRKKKKRKKSGQGQGGKVEPNNNSVVKVTSGEYVLNLEDDVMMQEVLGDDEEEISGTPMDFSDEMTTAKPKVVKTSKPKSKPKVVKTAKPRTRVKAPPSAKYKGPLTVFSPVSSSDNGSNSTTAVESTQIPIKRLNIILDTNIFLSHLSFVEELRDENITGFGRPMLIIPWIVLHELDSLKEGKASDLRDVRKHFKGAVVNKAKSAVHFIHSCLTNKHPRVQGQSIQECSKKDQGVYTRSNDDKILQCCLQYKNRARKMTEIVLLSEDMSLRNKAIVSGIHAYTQAGLIKGLAELAKELPKTSPSRSRGKDAKLSPKKSPAKKTSSKQLTKPLSVKAADDLVDDMICKLKKALRQSLSVVLEAEMKAAFDDLWLDVVLKKPPWTFLDILDSYEKHWIAVFSCICNRSIRNCFDKLRIFYKVNKGLGANIKIAKNLLEAGHEFLSHLKNHSSYSGALDGPIADLTNLLEQVDLFKTPSPATSTTPTCSSKPQPSYSSAKHTSIPSAASGKCETLRTLKKVTVRPNRIVRTRPASSQHTSQSETASESGVTPKKIKINRASIGSKVTPKIAPKTVQNVTPNSVESAKPLIEEQMVDQEIAMDTSTGQISPTRRNSEESMGQPEMPASSAPNNGETASGLGKLKNVSQKIGKAAALKFPEDSQNVLMRPVSSDKHSSQVMISHSLCTNTDTEQMMKMTLKSPLSRESGNFSGFSPPSSSLLPSDTSPSSSSTASGMLYSSNSSEEQVIANSNDVLRVLDTAYKEMYAMCVKVDEAIRMQELGENSTAQLNLKEAFTLVEYLVGYLEKEIVAMTKVLSVVKGNGLMGSISDDVYQELIDIIDGFFIGMEINLDGSNLTVEMLKSFTRRDENLLSLERGIDQYRVSLQGCQLCYNLLSQMQT